MEIASAWLRRRAFHIVDQFEEFSHTLMVAACRLRRQLHHRRLQLGYLTLLPIDDRRNLVGSGFHDNGF